MAKKADRADYFKAVPEIYAKVDETVEPAPEKELEQFLTKSQMIEFLRENLRIEIRHNKDYDSYGDSPYVNTHVEIYLGDEQISSGYDSFRAGS